MMKIKATLKGLPKPVLGVSIAAGLSCLAVQGCVMAFVLFNVTNPLPLGELDKVSVEMVDREGALLRAYTTPEGRWRLQSELSKVDPEFIKILLAYEDKRFYEHYGVDPLAVLRAAWQLVTNGRIASGASTITMQLARLIEPRENRTFSAKFLQMARAIQLEQRLTKDEILSAYLTLAPYGGNLEGIRAASLAYFDKEPLSLTLEQAALLVALPQSPVARRPDAYPDRARKARNTVLARMAAAGVIDQSEVLRVSSYPVSNHRYDLPQFAAHLADRIKGQNKTQRRHQVSLQRSVQQQLEQVAQSAADRLGHNISVALVLADGKTGDILAQVGSPDYLSAARAGWVDMSIAKRSPGSALKPFIYGLAFEEGLVRAETLITDQPINFGGYRPKNFDMDYQGEVSIRDALLLSLNVPAVALLDSVGPARLMERIRSGGADTVLPEDEKAGLAIGLGGIGISLVDLTQLYTAFVNHGHAVALRERPSVGFAEQKDHRVLSDVAAWHISDILIDARPPDGAPSLDIAYKTGTSYGYRDAWSVGYDGRHVLGVWVGKADNSSVPGITGRTAAAPILFEAFAKAGLEHEVIASAPMGAERQNFAELPPTLQHFRVTGVGQQTVSLPEPAPLISYPPDTAQIEIAVTATGQTLPLVLKLQDGRPPFRWMANGHVFETNGNRRRISWQPDGAGQSTLTVIDSAGRADSVSVFLKMP